MRIRGLEGKCGGRQRTESFGFGKNGGEYHNKLYLLSPC
jgi:hypothetical protein